MRPVYCLAILILTGCGQSQKNTTHKEKESRFKTLLAKFPSRSFDTLKVYSPEEFTGIEKGVELDSADAILFPKEIAEHHFIDPPGLYALFQFNLNKNFTGLVARTPSEYAPTSIKLFFYNKIKDSITGYVELAQNWGDAGDVSVKTSWLFYNKNRLRAFTMIKELHYNAAENESDTTVQEWNSYYLVDLSKQKADTISTNEKKLKQQFGHLAERTN